MKPIPISDLPPSFIERNRAQLGMGHAALHPCPTAILAPARPIKVKHRLRQSQKPLLNALETRFLAKLKADYLDQAIYSQAVRLELARGHWYKPDFFLASGKITSAGVRAIAYEVKGPRAFRGGFENLKTAARIHNWITFFLVWENDLGGWEGQEILP